MAGGGTLEPGSMVVAHRSLPFGTMIEFSYNGATCVAVVADRGPYIGGRVFDLGPGIAAALGFDGVGTVQYRIL
jgi:rare lipoprotein A (peptidoglycan hydrolase)